MTLRPQVLGSNRPWLAQAHGHPLQLGPLRSSKREGHVPGMEGLWDDWAVGRIGLTDGTRGWTPGPSPPRGPPWPGPQRTLGGLNCHV